ncbi:uncharacterized protein LOC119192417 [Manduca sexta]|uniref:uncharacterized protein LOC119192417 n=1 Tax=Manduca sexta TaxID=7130 RepID=UPI00189022DF|nr:uncharacterized protein LOC119192417 [Manduca sexta]
MPNTCTVCMNNSGKNRDISFFSYPKDQAKRHEWLQVVGRQDLIGKLDKVKARRNYRICERHFEPSCVKFSKNKTVKYLSDDAYPTLNMMITPPTDDCASTVKYEASEMNQHDVSMVVDDEISFSQNSSYYDNSASTINCEPASYQNYYDDVPLDIEDRASISANMAPVEEAASTNPIKIKCEGLPANDVSSDVDDKTSLFVNSPSIGDDGDTSKIKIEYEEVPVTIENYEQISLNVDNKTSTSQNEAIDLDRVTKEDFLKLCDKFLSKSMSELIKSQINVKIEPADGYSLALKPIVHG